MRTTVSGTTCILTTRRSARRLPRLSGSRPFPTFRVMAAARFSGQYAAAQLGRLPLPHTLLLGISEYIGHNPDLFLPPTYLTFARARGRLPTDVSLQFFDRPGIEVYEHELTDRDHMRATVISMGTRNRLELSYISGTIAQVRDRAGTCILAEIQILFVHTPEDNAFFARWTEQRDSLWPNTYTRQPLWFQRARRTADRAHRDLEEQSKLVMRIMRRHNSLTAAVAEFDNSDSD